MSKSYAVFGLGRYGLAAAKELSAAGAQVLAVDMNEQVVQSAAAYLPLVKCADVTDPDVLEVLGIANFDVVIIAMAEHMEACVMAVMLCKEAGVTMTGAGATFPLKNDPRDRNIRIAPTYPDCNELQQAMDLAVRLFGGDDVAFQLGCQPLVDKIHRKIPRKYAKKAIRIPCGIELPRRSAHKNHTPPRCSAKPSVM